MAIKRQVNFLGNMRVDVPHLRMVESAVVGDFQALSGTLMAGTNALVCFGAVLLDVGAVGLPATNLTLRMANAVLLHGTASEAGAIFTVPSSQPDDILSSSNPTVVGSFAPGITNYVGLDLVRTVDESTQDSVVFRSSFTKKEFEQVVPLSRTLDYTINISASNFAATPNLLPIARVVVDANGNVVSVTDCRQMFFRLGSGGTSPNPLATYAWANRDEAASPSTFEGGDKDITSQFSFNGAVLHRLWELGGGEHWYSPANDRETRLVYEPTSTFPNSRNFYWDGTNLVWENLRVVFGGSTAGVNFIADQPGANGATVQPSGVTGLTNLSDGDVIYVDVNRAIDAVTVTAYRAPRSWLAANQPSIPGSRHILAWRLDGYVFTGNDSVDITNATNVPVATHLVVGAVLLNHPWTGGGGSPKVAVVNASDWAVVEGVDRFDPGALSIGVNAATSLVFAQAGVTSTFNGVLATTRGITATQATLNGHAISGTGNGNGHGVIGTGGTSSGVHGVGGSGYAGVSGQGTGAGPGVTATGGTSAAGIVATGGSVAGDGILATGTGGGSGVRGVIGPTGTAGVVGDASASTGSGIGVAGSGKAGGAGVSGVGGATGFGVIGEGGGAAAGVYGIGGTTGPGVAGEGRGVAAGVSGVGGSSSGPGVRGDGGGPDGRGVVGTGVSAGEGVYGVGGDSSAFGVRGQGGQPDGVGVYGNGVGSGEGVVASASGSGAGIRASSATGPGGSFNPNATRGSIHLVPRAVAPTGVKGDLYCDTASPSALWFHDGTSWRAVTLI